MINSRRLRQLAILYAFQRMIEICISNKILPRDVLRDINPLLVTVSNSFDACNRSRIAQFPWIMAVHLNFVVFIYLVLLPLTFVTLKDSIYNDVATEKHDTFGAIKIYLFVIVLSYAFLGLYEMAIDIEDPFSFEREHHSFGVWGLWEYWTALQISDVRHIFGFHVREITIEAKNSSGAYGEHWSVEKLDPLIMKALKRGILKNSDQVKAMMESTQINTSFWNLFCDEKGDGSSSISFSTASDNDKSELKVTCVSNNIQSIYGCPAGYVSTPCGSTSSKNTFNVATLTKV